MGSCDSEKSPFFRDKLRFVEKEKESMEGGGAVQLRGDSIWGLLFLDLCAMRGLKIGSKQRP